MGKFGTERYDVVELISGRTVFKGKRNEAETRDFR